MPITRRKFWAEMVQAQKQAESPDYKPKNDDGKYSPKYHETDTPHE